MTPAETVAKSRSEMDLPSGKTCTDCANLQRCTMLFSVEPKNTWCDFYPVRFMEKL